MWLYTSLVFLQADCERQLLQLCHEGCTADITQFREILRRGVDVNIYDEVSVHVHMYSSRFPIHLTLDPPSHGSTLGHQKYIGKSMQLLYTV